MKHLLSLDHWDQDARANLSIAELLQRDTRPTAFGRSKDNFVQSVLEDVKQVLEDGTDDANEGTFEMANVRPEKSGLPFIVFISEKGRARHDVRVKVSSGPRARDFIATVAVRPDVQVLAGELSNSDLATLKKWIDLNRDVIVRYWDGDILYTEQALLELRSISE